MCYDEVVVGQEIFKMDQVGWRVPCVVYDWLDRMAREYVTLLSMDDVTRVASRFGVDDPFERESLWWSYHEMWVVYNTDFHGPGGVASDEELVEID